MRHSLPVAAALLTVFAATALGLSSPPIKVTVHPTVTPDKAGTPAHPQGVHLDVRINIQIPVNFEPPLVQRIDVWFPKGGLYNGASYPTCSYRRLNAFGPASCPKASIMGSGTGVARADTNLTFPKITVVNGGAHTVFFYTVLNNPARVQSPVPGTITKLSGRWSYELRVPIPKDLQVVAGVPIVLQSLHIAAGRGSWLATTFCPASHEWPYRAVTHFDNGQTILTTGTVGCH